MTNDDRIIVVGKQPAADVVDGFFYYSPWAFSTDKYPEVAESLFEATYTIAGTVLLGDEDEV